MKAGVVGAGLMGAEIALVFALGGIPVVLHDNDDAALEQALARLAALLARGVERGRFGADQAGQALAIITPAYGIAALSDCDFVTEAVSEALEVKNAVLRSLDVLCRDDCVLASNTSTLPISTLAAALSSGRRPNFLGTHYFSPVSLMKLVEVVPGFETDPAVVARVHALLLQLGKTPVAIKDVAGFAVNRLLHAMLIEAVRLVDEGVASPEDIDAACRLGLGHPIGPFALMDKVSSSLCLQVQEILHDTYGERFRPPALLKQRVAAGLSGGKGRAGWIGEAR